MFILLLIKKYTCKYFTITQTTHLMLLIQSYCYASFDTFGSDMIDQHILHLISFATEMLLFLFDMDKWFVGGH